MNYNNFKSKNNSKNQMKFYSLKTLDKSINNLFAELFSKKNSTNP
jgi:hypothetical protein